MRNIVSLFALASAKELVSLNDWSDYGDLKIMGGADTLTNTDSYLNEGQSLDSYVFERPNMSFSSILSGS